MNATERFTIAQAVTLGMDYIDDLCMHELDAHPSEIKAAAALWCALLCVDDDNEGARDDVIGDAALIVALSLPATEFLLWFRKCEWDCFERSDGPQGEAWAWGLLDAARAAVATMGAMAVQAPLTAALVRRSRAM